MNKRVKIGLATAGVLLLGAMGSGGNNPQTSKSNITKPDTSAAIKPVKTEAAPKTKLVCDGTKVTTDCTVDGTNYSTYRYHEAVPEKTHTENIVTTEKKVTGYCTLCNDGTYSPSCATGRGACSYHGGVLQWNAPEYTNVQVNTPKTVVDAPAQPAYYEKVAE